MTASTLTVAPAIDTTPSFHRSHSTSDLFSLSASLSKPAPPLPPSATTATPAAKSSSHVRALSLKSLPSLPAFDVPSFDFDPDFSSKLLLDAPLLGGPVTKPTKQQAKEVDVRPKPVQVERPLPKPGGGSGAEAGGTGGGGGGILNRKRSIIDRPRSWMPTTRSTPNFRELIQEQARSRPSADGGRERVRERQSGLFDQPPRLQLPGLEQDGGIQLEKKNVARAGADVETAPRSVAGDRGRTVSDSFTALSKRSWMTMRSRSPSPVSKERARPEKSLPEKPLPEPAAPVVERSIGVGGESMGKDWFADLGNFNIVGPTKEPEPDSEAEPELELSSARKRPAVELESSRTSNSPSGTARAISRASVYLSKIKQKPQSVFSKSAAVAVNGDSDSCASSATSLADNRRSQSPSENTTMTTTDDMSSSAASSDMAVQTPEKPRDPLWAQFKKLEAEFLRFQAKNTTVRVSIVRTTLFPFLRTYAHHESNRDLAAEDLDRRCVILNRWWGALLEMLDPNYPTTMGGTLAGVDRAAVLECVTLIMTRPEWRRTTSYFCPLRDRHPGERVRARSWTQSSMNSLSAISAAAAAESAETNVRNMFVTNLLTQMQLVVDRMSARHVPNSVVNFCGRACAYAFFFAPGIADVLVRLWGLAPDLIRRVADELGLPRRSRGESEDIVALFPPCLSGLGWSSVKTMTDLLRQNVKLPLLASTIPWHGPWVPRWKGRDTDLLFVFAKHFHILAEEFMPSGLPLIEKARAPAFVLVHCQLLSCLDSTIHRQAAVDALLGGPFMAAEGFGGPDAASFLGGAGGAGPMATPPLLTQNHNVFKGMSENRMIMLLKDFLIEGAGAGIDDARNTFAEAFMAVIRAATKRTSQFDHNACFTLCDFLEEALPAYEAFRELEQPDDPVGGGFVDWDFWFGVCRMVLDSNNTVSEIRMLAFVFAMWDIAVASDPVRKEAVCINWLLTEDNFNKFFNHWCPMVRAYYHRLLCWRVCRDAGSANEVDA